MAIYSLWALGILLCILSAAYLYKCVTHLRTDILFQKHFKKIHPESTLGSFDQGWILLNIVLILFVLSMASQANGTGSQNDFAPDTLCMIGIAIYLAGATVRRWDKSRLIFYRQGIVFEDQEIPYQSIQSLTPTTRHVELKSRKGIWLVSRKQGSAIEEHKAAWQKARKSK